MHPLTPDLSNLTDEELYNKRNELQNRLGYAYRAGYSDMVNQLNMLIQDYMLEIERRNQKMLEDARKAGRFGSGDDTAKDLTR